MNKRVFSGSYAAWIAHNGRSFFDKPRKLYISDGDELWDIGGNDSVHVLDVPGFSVASHGTVTFTSNSEDDVALVIAAGRAFFDAMCAANGVKDAS